MLDVIAESDKDRRQHRIRLRDLLKKTVGLVRIASAYVTETDLLPRPVHLIATFAP
jgi:hypothetical protein